MMEENERKQLEEVKEELKYKIITLEDDTTDSKVKKAIEAILDEINHRFDEFKTWCDENKDSEKAQEMKAKFLDEMNTLTNKAKGLIDDLKNNEDLRQKIEAGKVTILDVTSKVMNVVEDGVNDVLENPTVNKTIEQVSDKVVEVLRDEKVQQGIQATKKGILNVAEKGLEGLKKVLKVDELD